MPMGPGKPPTKEQDAALNKYLSAEADFFNQLKGSVQEVNNILKGLAGKDSPTKKLDYKNNTYVSRDDYKNFFNLDDATIDSWISYATDVLGEEQLVRGMPKTSFLKGGKKHQSKQPQPKVNKANIKNKKP